jgi:hypothetical protein
LGKGKRDEDDRGNWQRERGISSKDLTESTESDQNWGRIYLTKKGEEQRKKEEEEEGENKARHGMKIRNYFT